MSLKLMYITNRTEIAQIAENAGVDRIFVDMEYIGKAKRQGGMDTVQSHHTIEDIKNIKNTVTKAEVMVRINPIHESGAEYVNSEEEIDAVIEAGADIIMLPFFKTMDEVRTFIKSVAKRVRTILLVETPEAVNIMDEILAMEGVDEIFIGLNDLSLGYGRNFMFEILADGTIDRICHKCSLSGIPYGFGGIASLGKGDLPAEYIIKEHYRLGSTCVILSRSFCDVSKEKDMEEINRVFAHGVKQIRELEDECQEHISYFTQNRSELIRKVEKIVARKKQLQ